MRFFVLLKYVFGRKAAGHKWGGLHIDSSIEARRSSGVVLNLQNLLLNLLLKLILPSFDSIEAVCASTDSKPLSMWSPLHLCPAAFHPNNLTYEPILQL